MSRKVTIRISDEIAEWLRERSRRQGISMSRIVLTELEQAMLAAEAESPTAIIGSVRGLPRNLSTRKGFSRH